jgi:hypothetical protein
MAQAVRTIVTPAAARHIKNEFPLPRCPACNGGVRLHEEKVSGMPLFECYRQDCLAVFALMGGEAVLLNETRGQVAERYAQQSEAATRRRSKRGQEAAAGA